MKQMAKMKFLVLVAPLLTGSVAAVSAEPPIPDAARWNFDATARALQGTPRELARVDPSTLGTLHFDICDPFGLGWSCHNHPGGR